MRHFRDFQLRRRESNEREKCFNILIGICVIISLFWVSNFTREYVAVHEANEKIIAEHEMNSKLEFKHPKWDYFPYTPRGEKPEFGILMGGTRNMFNWTEGSPLSLTMISTCVNKLFALKNRHAFKLVTNLEDVTNRTYGACESRSMTPWNKIKLVEQYLPDVQYLLWLDLDAVIIRPKAHILSFLNTSNKVNDDDNDELGTWLGTADFTKDKHRQRRRLLGSSPHPFLWASRDLNPKYWVNLNTAVFVMRSVPIAFDFLKEVWAVGDDPDCFKKHDWNWAKKTACQGYYGWPWEQGGVWDVLSNESNLDYLRGTIVLPNEGLTALNSVTDQLFLRRVGTPFVLHGKTVVDNHVHYGKMLLRIMGISNRNMRDFCPEVSSRGDQFANLTKDRKDILRYELSL